MKFLLEKGDNVEIILVSNNTKELSKGSMIYNYLKEKELFKGKLNEIYADLSPNGENIILLGLGDESKLTLDSLRNAFYKVGKEIMKYKVESAGVTIPKFGDLCYKSTMTAITEGLLQSEYSYDKYLSEGKIKPCVKEIYFDVLEDKKEKVLEGIKEAEILVEGIFLTRDLVNERPMHMYPEILANAAKDNLEELGIKVDIYDKAGIEKLGMKAFLAVSEGSSKEPRFFVMTYTGDPDSDEKIALVGKGLTYDSGGYAIKPGASMDTMFTDMAGSATVIGALKAIAKGKLKKNVVGVVAACENLISGAAYKNGDILKSLSGKTIEVLNTDAEGRITLADALWYTAKEIKADKIIDLATLTGACVVALGGLTSGAITNDDKLMSEVREAAELSGEYVWQLPSYPEYRELIKGDFGDLKNTGGRGAGTITAGLFLEEFVDEVPWVHLDIAGTAYDTKARGYLPKGATGIHVKTLYYLVKNM
ncbi:MAG: leucyl aminopeptidase [Tissierella sp.]|nr:leucyl aminopeptidase [Tissierella sp.]